jgi:hypothetical protein
MKSPGRYQESRLRSGAPWSGHINKPSDGPVRTSIETRRLILRPFESGDVEAAFAWFGDPRVMRFTPTGPDASIERTKARLANYHEHQTEHGFSRWMVLDRHVGRPIGDSGLLALQEYGRIDLGFRSSPATTWMPQEDSTVSCWMTAATRPSIRRGRSARVAPTAYLRSIRPGMWWVTTQELAMPWVQARLPVHGRRVHYLRFSRCSVHL